MVIEDRQLQMQFRIEIQKCQNIIIMEKQLKCALLLSLKELTLRRVAALLWNGSDILASIANSIFLSFDEDETGWGETTKDKVKDEVSKLVIPKSLTKPMIDILRSMTLDIKRWARGHKDYFLDSWYHYEYPDEYDYSWRPWPQYNPPDITKLCWTAAGIIDDRKTAEELLRCEDLYLVELRYELACFYCLEDYIPHLWKKLPKERKFDYYNYKGTEPRLRSCWPHILKGELSKLDYLLSSSDRNPFTFYQCVFEYSAENGNRTATEYFFRKLTFEERDDSLMRSIHATLTKIQYIDPDDPDNFQKENDISSVLCYLLSVMTPVQQMEILESRPLDVLFSFLGWPWQDLFLENLGLIWTFLPPSSYGELLKKMDSRYCNATDFNFYLPKSCQELFIQSPLEFKQCFVDEEHKSYYINFLQELFNFDYSETLGVIFLNLDAASRVKLLFHHEILDYFLYYESGAMWSLVELCLRETMLSKEDKERLKKSLMEYLNSDFRAEIECDKQSLKRFFELLDSPDVNADEGKKSLKRKLENCWAE